MRIILSADDFGIDAATNREIIGALERGSVSGASIMANMPGFNEASRYAREHRSFCFGVHLCFVEGHALSGVLSTLTDNRGIFNKTAVQRLKAILWVLSVDEIAQEIRAQIAKVVSNGVRVDYADSHGHMHKLKPFREALEQVLPSFGIKKVRNAQTIFLTPKYTSPTYVARRHFSNELTRRFDTTSEFYMPTSTADRRWGEVLVGRLDSSDRSIEIGIHPGLNNKAGSEEPDAQHFTELCLDAGHRMISWKDL